MKTNIKIVIEYDGSNFSGWQIQKKKITIQYELEKALSTILNQNGNRDPKKFLKRKAFNTKLERKKN